MLNFQELARFARIAQKELRETLRDRRTVLTLLMMPLLLYPMLSLVLQRLVLSGAGENRAGLYRLGVSSKELANDLLETINASKAAISNGPLESLRIIRDPKVVTKLEKVIGNSALASKSESVDESQSLSANDLLDGDVFDREPMVEKVNFSVLLVDGSLTKALDNGEIDLAIVDSKKPGNRSFQIRFRDGNVDSEAALAELKKAFAAINNLAISNVRREVGLPDRSPVEMLAMPISSSRNEESGLVAIIPLILILMTITGAVYPAIDLTAGERERGTLEALIASPISRFKILASKYIAVVSVSVLTALINLLAMTITLKVTGVGSALLGGSDMTWLRLFQAFPLLILFAAFFSSILLALCSFARSFKEAQAYLIPVMLLSLGPGIISLMPTVKLTSNMAVVPLVNLILLARDTLGGSATLTATWITIITTTLYTLAALMIAANGFGRQAASVGEDFRWSDLIRRPTMPSLVPTGEHLIAFLGMFFPIYFVITNVMSGSPNDDIRWIAIKNAIATFGLFVILPSLFSFYQRFSFQETYRLTWGRNLTIGLISAIVFASSLWIVAFEILHWSEYIGLRSLDVSQMEAAKELQAKFLAMPWWLVVVTMAIVPAICEEFFFRGFVLSTLAVRYSTWKAIVFSAIIFGLFHVVSGSLLSLERFLPTAMLGIFLAWLAIRTGSLLPGIVLHAAHNGLLFSFPYLEGTFRRLGFDRIEGRLPWTWIVAGLATVLLTSLVFYAATFRRSVGSDSIANPPTA